MSSSTGLLALVALWALASRSRSNDASSPTPSPTPTPSPEPTPEQLAALGPREAQLAALAERERMRAPATRDAGASVPVDASSPAQRDAGAGLYLPSRTPAANSPAPAIESNRYEPSAIVNGRWTLSASLATLADSIARGNEVPWSGGSRLPSDDLSRAQLPLTPGFEELARYLRRHTGLSVGTARGRSVQAPARRADGTLRNRDVHEDGRAADVMTDDVATGTAVADWLLQHAAALGIQQLIWHRGYWSSSRPSSRRAHSFGAYSGRHPHTDHVHVELSVPWAYDVARMRDALAAVAPLTIPGGPRP